MKREGYKIVSKSNKDKEQLKNYTEEDKKWVEGKPRLVKHLKKERASGLAKAKKDSFLSIHGYLFCERCKVNPKEVYGPFGESCLEVHHCKTTVSRMDKDHVTDLEDLQVLCANCHRIVHKELREQGN